MSSDKDTDSSELKSDKPVKRVRFSDECNDVYLYEREESVGNIPMEDESCAVSNEFPNFNPNESSSEEQVKNVEDSVNVTDTSNSSKCISESCVDLDELIKCNKNVIITDDSGKDGCYQQFGESSTSHARNDTPPLDYLSDNNNDSDMVDLNLLIRETEHMAISPPKPVSDGNQGLSSQGFSSCSSCDSNSEKNAVKLAKQPTQPSCNLLCPTRKRSSEGVLIERQTSKMKEYLKKENPDVNSAVGLKNAAFNAWNKVKNENAHAKNTPSVPQVKEKIDTLPKVPDGKHESRKDGITKKSTANTKKASSKDVEASPKKTKEDIEESKMAFRAWKKKKDELLNQQIAEKRKKEEKKRLDSLMNERMRKNHAESAYLAWYSLHFLPYMLEKDMV